MDPSPHIAIGNELSEKNKLLIVYSGRPIRLCHPVMLYLPSLTKYISPYSHNYYSRTQLSDHSFIIKQP